MRSHSNFNVNKRFEITKKMIEARRKKIIEELLNKFKDKVKD